MAYKQKSHRNTHQMKSRLNDHAYADLKAEADKRGKQPGELVRELTLGALKFQREHGYFPLVDDAEADTTLDNFPMLRERARELNVTPREMADLLISEVAAFKLEHGLAPAAKKQRNA
ncbi:hypothetical protein ACIPL1_24855 [Pseudomonas sp. NPDC090202]|uniref:hypothetical protein n=1 Tax=Pseudomonas sp. NPDC090202 TaxID=3364476 RepID=UPI0038162C81